MKNVTMWMLAGLTSLSPSFGFAQEISKKNWTLIHERTADWCPFCGSWGWDLKNQFINKFQSNNVIFMAVHHSGGLTNPTADTLSANFGGVGQPLFFVDGVNINASSNSISTKLQETELEVEFKNSVSVIAAGGVEANLSETNKTLTAKAKVEFLEGVENGDYYLGLYLLEDVMHPQSGRTGLQLHKNVLRASLFPNTFGKALKKGAVAKGTKFEVTAELKNVTAKRISSKVLGVIWNKASSGKYIFFNAFITTPEAPSSADDSRDLTPDVKAFQNENGDIVVTCNSTGAASKPAIVSLRDMKGQPHASSTVYTSENNGFTCVLNRPSVAGLYIVHIELEGRQFAERIIIPE